MEWFSCLLVLLVAAASAQDSCNSWIAGNATFVNVFDIDFSDPAATVDLLGTPSFNTVQRYPISGIFEPDNVRIDNGTLQLIINAYNSTLELVQSAQISSNIDNILYASVRTEMLSSTIGGVGQTSFFYADPQNEVDMTLSVSEFGRVVWFIPYRGTSSNQLFLANAPHDLSITDAPNATVAMNVSPTAEFHTYRVDWLPNNTVFYVDNQQIGNLTSYSPSEPGPWYWSVWSDGNSTSLGPPTQQSYTFIRRITFYYNTSSDQPVSGGQTCTVEDSPSTPLAVMWGMSSGSSSSTMTISYSSTSSASVSSTSSDSGTSASGTATSSATESSSTEAPSSSTPSRTGTTSRSSSAVTSNPTAHSSSKSASVSSGSFGVSSGNDGQVQGAILTLQGVRSMATRLAEQDWRVLLCSFLPLLLLAWH